MWLVLSHVATALLHHLSLTVAKVNDLFMSFSSFVTPIFSLVHVRVKRK